MWAELFNYENPVWRFIGKFWDLMLVHIIWLVCSIPIITIGANTTALYYVTIHLVRNEDGPVFRSFFKSFKENFKQATLIWLIFLAAVFVIGFDLYFVLTIMEYSTMRSVLSTALLAMLFIWFAMFTFVFPLQCRYYNPIRKTIINSFVLSIRHIFHTIAMLLMDFAIVLLTFTFVPQLMLFGFSLPAFLNSYLLNNVFKRYEPEERGPEDEMRPLFDEEDNGPVDLSVLGIGDEDDAQAQEGADPQPENEKVDPQISDEAGEDK